MFQLVYFSSATKLLSRGELINILEKSRVNNSSLGITGMLLYKDGNIMQVLEGDEQQVKDLYLKISKDNRHKDAVVLVQENLLERQFSEWSMAFRDLDSADVRALPGYSEFLNTSLKIEEFQADHKKGLRLLYLFRKNMR